MSEKLTDGIRAQLALGLVDIGPGTADDRKECAYITLKGTTERFLMLLQYRSERNYETGMKALEQSIAEYRALVGSARTP